MAAETPLRLVQLVRPDVPNPCLQADVAKTVVRQEDKELLRRERPPRPPPYRSAPVLRPYNQTFSECFGNVQRTSEANTVRAPVPMGQR